MNTFNSIITIFTVFWINKWMNKYNKSLWISDIAWYCYNLSVAEEMALVAWLHKAINVVFHKVKVKQKIKYYFVSAEIMWL